MNKFSQRLKQLREKAGLTGQQLADSLGNVGGKSGISRYENGGVEANIDRGAFLCVGIYDIIEISFPFQSTLL